MTPRIIIQDTGNPGFKRIFMGSAVHCVNIIRKGYDVFIIAVIILQRHLGNGIAVVDGNMNDLRMQHLIAAGLIHKINKRRNTAFVAVLLFHHIVGIAAVVETYAQAGVQEGLLAQAFLQHLKIVFRGFRENLVVRLETNGRTVVFRRADHGQIVNRHTAFEPLRVDVSIPGDFHFHPFGQRVYHRGTHAVQAAGDFIA